MKSKLIIPKATTNLNIWGQFNIKIYFYFAV